MDRRLWEPDVAAKLRLIDDPAQAQADGIQAVDDLQHTSPKR